MVLQLKFSSWEPQNRFIFVLNMSDHEHKIFYELLSYLRQMEMKDGGYLVEVGTSVQQEQARLEQLWSILKVLFYSQTFDDIRGMHMVSSFIPKK